MRAPAKARVLLTATVTLGLGVLAVALVSLDFASLPTLALFGAAVVLTELFQVASADDSEDPEHTHAFSFSSGVHIAAVLVAGPLAAALVAAFGVVAVDGLRGQRSSKVLFNASVFALASATGGLGYVIAGGQPGVFDLPSDLVGIAILALTYSALNLTLVTMIISFTASSNAWRTLHHSFWSALPSTVSEAGLGMLLALCVFEETWAVAALIPLVLSVYLAHARLALLRRETTRALETFANVVDERDPHTYRHSARVAEYVRELALGLRLPPAEVARLHWAGRLHDLGKVSVDAAVLQKPGRLGAEEWAAMRRHPRLSARLLQRFHFAASEARAVEYHHERFDGGGYYGIEAANIPLAAHLLIVADSYDAMTSDRPYRAGLSSDKALAEIEAQAGKQFHPLVAKAFVAQMRGTDPATVLTPQEHAQLRASVRRGRAIRAVRTYVRRANDATSAAAVSAALLAFGLGYVRIAVAACALALTAVCWRRFEVFRGHRLSRSLATVLASTGSRGRLFADLTSELAYTSQLRWAGLVSWRERELDGSVEFEWGSRVGAPSPTAVTSWLLREREADGDDLLEALGDDLVGSGAHVALALRDGGTVTGYLVLGFARSVPRHVDIALRRSCGCFGALAFRAAEPGQEPRSLVAVR